jgi:hypothetical protein
MCSVLEVERENARRTVKEKISHRGEAHTDHGEEKPRGTGRSACATREEERER